MTLREKLLADAALVSPWVTEWADISNEALAAVVYYGAPKDKPDAETIKNMGGKRVLGWMIENYGDLIHGN